MQNQNANDGMTCSPAEFSLLGSNDGENWDNLGDYTNNNYSSSASKTYITKNISKKYLYYRIFIKQKWRMEPILVIHVYYVFNSMENKKSRCKKV